MSLLWSTINSIHIKHVASHVTIKTLGFEGKQDALFIFLLLCFQLQGSFYEDSNGICSTCVVVAYLLSALSSCFATARATTLEHFACDYIVWTNAQVLLRTRQDGMADDVDT